MFMDALFLDEVFLDYVLHLMKCLIAQTHRQTILFDSTICVSSRCACRPCIHACMKLHTSAQNTKFLDVHLDRAYMHV